MSIEKAPQSGIEQTSGNQTNQVPEPSGVTINRAIGEGPDHLEGETKEEYAMREDMLAGIMTELFPMDFE